MFTTGFDLGTENCVVAVARKGGIDIIANEASYRTTPALVTFGAEQRFVGQAAAAQFKRNVPNTVANVKRLLGRRFHEEDVQRELPFLKYKIRPLDDDGDIGIELRQGGQLKTFTPVQVCAALLGQLKRTAEASLGQEVRDVVIGVPGWWNDRQRRALLDAAAVADLKCLQLVNELTACGLELGIRKDRQLDKDSELVCFFDMGDTQTQCAVMRYTKGKLEVLGYGYDQHLGGRNFTEAIADHFKKEWLEKYKIDIDTNARARLRTTEACQKLKHVLSSNAFGNVSLDCLMDDKDVSGKLQRQEFVDMVGELLERVLLPVQQALDAAGVSKDDIQSVEVVGDSHRIPAVADKLQSFFGKAPSKRTNATEVVAKGAAWQCARKSPLFKVMPYELKDLQSYPVDFTWRWGQAGEDSNEEGGGNASLVFPPRSAVPLFKQVTFKKNIVEGMTFTASASYADGVPLPAGTSTNIGRWTISNIPVDPANMVAGEKAALKIGCKLDDSGVVTVSRAEKEWNEEVEYTAEEEVPLTEEEKKAKEAEAAAAGPTEVAEEEKKAESDEKPVDEASAESKPGDAAKDAAPAAEKKKEEEKKAQQPLTKKVKVTKKRVVARSSKLDIVSSTASLAEATVKRLREQEQAMLAHDRLVIATGEEKNKVETYVYEAREKLSGAWETFGTDQAKDELRSLLEQTENWLYEEGENEKLDVYTAKLAQLRALGDPMALRAREAEERDAVVAELRSTIAEWEAWAEGSDPAFAHITDEEKQSVKEKAKLAREWLEEGLAKQKALKPTDDPAVLVADIVARRENLNKEAQAVRNKPKPKPKVEEPKKEEPKKEADTEAAKPADPTSEPEGKKEDGAEPMDTSPN